MKWLTTAALAALLPWPALAASYEGIDPAHSNIRFHYSQMGVSMDGDFPRFEGALRFDPAAPEQGHAEIRVFLDRIDTGTDEGNQEVVTKTWLDVAAHPVATFETTAIRALGEGRYEATGTLTIKGARRTLMVPATFSEQSGRGVLEGRFSITRGDYAIGEGAWSAADIVAADVGVSFSLAAKPVP